MALIWSTLALKMIFRTLNFRMQTAPRFSDVSSEAAYWICQTITQVIFYY